MNNNVQKRLEELKSLLQKQHDECEEQLQRSLHPDIEKEERSRYKEERTNSLLCDLQTLADDAREMRGVVEEDHHKRLADVKKEVVAEAFQQKHEAQVQQIIAVMRDSFNKHTEHHDVLNAQEEGL